MSKPLSFSILFHDSIGRAGRVIVPSLPFAVAFVLAAGGLVYSAGTLPEGGAGFVMFSGLTLATLFAHSLFSAVMYRAVLAHEGGLLGSAWKLTLAWLLVMVVASIAATMIVLFFSLIGASLGVVSGEAGQEITDMTAQMRANGTFWPLFAVFVATLIGLFWFAVRLMLFAGATAVRNRIHVFRTWAWTKGYFPVLAPLMILLIMIPIITLSVLAEMMVPAAFGETNDPQNAALATAFVTTILVPSAWLGHGFAASVLNQLSPLESA